MRLRVALMTGLGALGLFAASPAGQAVATPSFSLIYTAQFTDSVPDPNVWTIFNNSGLGDSSRLASNVVVHDGMVTLHSRWNSTYGEWTHAGMCACNRPDLIQKYGKYEVRMRANASHNRVVALLWPTGGAWPPEVDFTEMGGGDGAQGLRQTDTQTLHYVPNNSQIHSSYDVDLTQWHVVGVEWTPGVLKYTLDGTVMKTISTSDVPSQNMWLGLQTGYQDGVSHSDHSEDTRYDIDWVKIYDYQP